MIKESRRVRIEASIERVRELLSYNHETGLFVWLVNGRGRFKRAGAVAGTQNHWGYISITIDGFPYMAHRLAWLLQTGAWPHDEIDHINGNRCDNRIENLRDVPRSINAQNLRGPRSDSLSGVLGVSWNMARKKWIAAINLGGNPVHLGGFIDKDQAQAAYIEAKREMHAGCTI